MKKNNGGIMEDKRYNFAIERCDSQIILNDSPA